MDHVTEYKLCIIGHICANDNEKLSSTLGANNDLNMLLIEDRGYEILYSKACRIGNTGSLYILRDHGFEVKHIHYELIYEDEHENWQTSPLAIAFERFDVDMMCILLEMGFKASCPVCIDMCCPKTCIVYSMFTVNYRKIGLENLERIIKASDKYEVLASFEKYIDRTNRNIERLDIIFEIICRTIPTFDLSNVSFTVDNLIFVTDLVNGGFINLDTILEKTVNFLMGSYIYDIFSGERRFNIPTSEEMKNIIKNLIDLGADIDKVMTLKFSFFRTTLPESDDKSGSYGSLVEILRSIIVNRNDTVDSVFFGGEGGLITELFENVVELYEYVIYTKRMGFISKRIRGIGEDEIVDFVTDTIVNVESCIFANIMKFV